ncbi:hypothetical protein T01_16305 [Trichinella spiralis]|uniref:Uncharacterized protein n=1 Tax=Trichinella spiralis TaxID=6334 RepID=A0A0V1ANM5_TRISP|nr:hypothetical protein T01_16305 [Trichinella spiralis]
MLLSRSSLGDDVPVLTGGFVWSALPGFRRIYCPFFMARALWATFSHSKDRSKRLKFLSLEGLIYCVVHVSSVRRISEQGPPPILRPKFPSTSTGTARCQQPYYRNTFPIFKYHCLRRQPASATSVYLMCEPKNKIILKMLMYEPVGGSVRLRFSGSKVCQVRLTGAGEELTVALGSSWTIEYGPS